MPLLCSHQEKGRLFFFSFFFPPTSVRVSAILLESMLRSISSIVYIVSVETAKKSGENGTNRNEMIQTKSQRRKEYIHLRSYKYRLLTFLTIEQRDEKKKRNKLRKMKYHRNMICYLGSIPCQNRYYSDNIPLFSPIFSSFQPLGPINDEMHVLDQISRLNFYQFLSFS